ncbi:MAG TPA: hypothetical protein VF174_11460 [Micromonosporaceae bacterium]
MAKVHGKNTVVKVDDNDLSQYCNTSEFEATKDTHDTTGYGADGHEFSEGLTNGTFTMGGVYDSTAGTGPRAVLKPLTKAGAGTVTVVRQIEGTGAGKPQDSFTAILTSYTESAPVADMVAWQAEFQISGDVDDTPQS